METAPVVNIAALLSDWARKQPGRPAFVVSAGRRRDGRARYHSLTFAELESKSSAYARGLRRCGIEWGTRTLLLVPPSLESVALAFALSKVGAPLIAIDPRIGRANFLACVEECAPEGLIGVTRAHVMCLLYPRVFRTVRCKVAVGRRIPWLGGTPLAHLDTTDRIDAVPLVEPRAEDMAAVVFTSGSTGVPKGVVYTHGMFAALAGALGRLYGAKPSDVDVATFPLFVLCDILVGLTAAVPGADLTRPATCNSARIIEMIHDQGATLTFGSPALWSRVAAYCMAHDIRLPTLRRVFMAGASVPSALHDRLLEITEPTAETFTPYGATEALPLTWPAGREILAATASRADAGAGVYVGRPIAEVTLRIIQIVDEAIPEWENAIVLPTGQIGEIVVKGAYVTQQYFRRDVATRLAKIREGDGVWHRMGDVGYLDVDGCLWFCGRKAHRVELPSGPLYTEPVEGIFNQHPRVSRSALVKVMCAGRQEAAIIIEPCPGAWPWTASARRTFIAELKALGAARPMTRVIDVVLFHRAFPVDARHNAKILREKLAVWAQARVHP